MGEDEYIVVFAVDDVIGGGAMTAVEPTGGFLIGEYEVKEAAVVVEEGADIGSCTEPTVVVVVEVA